MNLNILFKVVFWRGVSALLSFFTVLLCIKNLSVDDFANYSSAFTIYTAFCLIPNLGINNFLVFENGNSDIEKKNYYIKIYYLIFIFFISFLCFFNLISNLYFYAIVTGIFGSMFDFNLVRYQAKKQFRKYAILMPLRTVVFFLSLLFVIYIEGREIIVENIFKFSACIFSIYYLYFLKDKISLDVFKFKENIQIFNGARSFLIHEVCMLLMVRAEVWILTMYSAIGFSKSDLANYWAAFNFILIISILGNTLASIVLPYIQDESKDGMLKLEKMVKKVSLMMFGVLVLTVILVYFISNYYFSKDYKELPYYVAVLGVGVLFGFLANIDRLKLIKFKNKFIDNMLIFQLMISILLNFILIYFYGVWGAIICYVFVRFLGFFSFKMFLRFNYGR
ncbi:MATE family efflux transporter [Acinetobacter tianfuensis]|uniref:Polysaccharide biosynthesis protein n=1 Tax=Acinetobacter tianfuensis TaxID=2419603 RepID=A0A3A8EME0_9GAMM|nr:hypothetical protein [Acinetobacter tianfuensis]RKG31910.1 hypothetical protein D7V32_07030 [Acinetobacter tianfuensis]